MSEEENKQEELELDVAAEEEEEEEDHEGKGYDDLFNATYGDKTVDEDSGEDEDPEDKTDDGEASEGTVSEDEGDGDEPSQPYKQADDPYAWIEDLPEEQRAKAELLKHAAESDKGRVSAYNRRLSQLQQEVDRLRVRPSKTAGQEDQDSSGESAAAPELPEEFKQLKEDFPEFAEAVDAIRKYDRTAFDKIVADRLQPLEEARAVDRRKSFVDQVSDGAEEIFDTKETGIDWRDITKSENFLSWLEQQPRSVQIAAATPDAKEALNVLVRYEDDYQRSITSNEDTTTTQDQEEQPTKPNKADEIKHKRTQRKKSGVSSGSKPAPGDGGSGGGGDYEAEFNATWG